MSGRIRSEERLQIFHGVCGIGYDVSIRSLFSACLACSCTERTMVCFRLVVSSWSNSNSYTEHLKINSVGELTLSPGKLARL